MFAFRAEIMPESEMYWEELDLNSNGPFYQ